MTSGTLLTTHASDKARVVIAKNRGAVARSTAGTHASRCWRILETSSTDYVWEMVMVDTSSRASSLALVGKRPLSKFALLRQSGRAPVEK